MAFWETLDRVTRDELAAPEHPGFWFVKHMQVRLGEVNPDLSSEEAFRLAAQAYRAFLTDEKIEFGDPAFGWDRESAREVIQAYEIDHWDAPA